MKTLLLFPHQLFLISDKIEKSTPIILVEEYLFFKEFNFHKQKLVFHRVSMKEHCEALQKEGFTVEYIETTNNLSDIRILIPDLASRGITQLICFLPDDNWLEKRLNEGAKKNNITIEYLENPLFLNTRTETEKYFVGNSFFQTNFYKKQRIERQILLEEDGKSPIGGKWSFDGENRKKYPSKKAIPFHQLPAADQNWKDACKYVETHFPKNIGNYSTSTSIPFTTQEAEKWLQQFFDYRFAEFGMFEDAMLKKEWLLNHSFLSPMMNVGILSPQYIVDKALAFAKENNVPINSLEGFVRQIIGWREFIRGIYHSKGSIQRTTNFWGFERKIPASFYDGTTGIPPIDETIKRTLETGYAHHIERLMVIGNFFVLCEFDPDEVYRWFMEMYVDAYDWVMVPNVYGMTQFADGGIFATKPYISASNYILKMSDYEKGDWQQIWDGLFWRFMSVNRSFFAKNPRLGMLLGSLDKMEESKRTAHFEHATRFLAEL